MNTILWILQGLMAFTFFYSGFCKSFYSESVLVTEKGQTGVEGLPMPFIRFIGLSEILGAIGLILPQWLNVMPVLTALSAACFAGIMIPAAVIHFRRHELKNVMINAALFLTCAFIALERTIH